VDVEERTHYPVIVDPDPSMQIAQAVDNVCDNLHVLNEGQQILNERMGQLERSQELLFETSRKTLHNSVKHSRQLGYIDEELQYASRMDPEIIREREVEYIAPRPLLVDAPHHHHRERAYIGDGVRYITSRPHRRPGRAPRTHYSETEGSESDEPVFDYEPLGSRRRAPVVHQSAGMCGGIGRHMARSAKW
jgi:hypothetical protein